MNLNTLKFDRQDSIGLLTLNRPDRLNAITLESIVELRDFFAEMQNDYETRVIILRGAGRAFCAGLDLKADVFEPADNNTLGMLQFRYKIQQIFSNTVINMRRCPQPIIAVVRGAASGAGFSLTLACDARIAGQSARFNAAFIRVGLTGGDMGSSYFLPRLIGLARATEYLMTGRFIDAATAEKIGLISQMVPDDQADACGIELARDMLRNSPWGLRMTKELLGANLNAPGIESALHMENRSQVLCMSTEDFTEGTTAFLEKRNPSYKGR